jgi:outer membrane protein assembly factor BamD (BamD/ComL family)
MKKTLIAPIFAFIAFFIAVGSVHAQRNVTPVIDRDPLMEADAKHNLDVARSAFTLKKAYKGVLMRFEETYAAYPEFSKIDEFLYLAGMSSYYLSENKGKQPINMGTEKDKEKYAPERLRADAAAYFGTILIKYPQSSYRDEAEKALKLLKASQ